MIQTIDFQIKKISNSGTLTDRVYEKLMELISQQSLPAGSKLPSEANMAIQFGVSRTVIREAVSRLKSEGLVESKQGRGGFLREPSLDSPFRISPNLMESIPSVLQVVELRQALEGEIASLAATRRSQAQLRSIEKALKQIEIEELAGHDGVAADISFHQSIAAASGNPHFLSLIEFLFNLLKNATRMTRSYESSKVSLSQEVKKEHLAIVDAIKRKDSQGARIAARRHMEGATIRLSTLTDLQLRDSSSRAR